MEALNHPLQKLLWEHLLDTKCQVIYFVFKAIKQMVLLRQLETIKNCRFQCPWFRQLIISSLDTLSNLTRAWVPTSICLVPIKLSKRKAHNTINSAQTFTDPWQLRIDFRNGENKISGYLLWSWGWNCCEYCHRCQCSSSEASKRCSSGACQCRSSDGLGGSCSWQPPHHHRCYHHLGEKVHN